MSEADKPKWYDPAPERLYILGAVHALVQLDSSLDDPAGILDGIIDAALVDAFKFGWVIGQAREEG